ncbi:MAG: hypothetical protein L0Y32_01020 [Nevskiales bacterium]|nr:hypothetical protein [Nevskiales bacterium]
MPWIVVALAAVLALSACGPEEETPATPPDERGRAETRLIRNTEAVGYSGEAIADKVDAALDANEVHAEQVRQQVEEQTR